MGLDACVYCDCFEKDRLWEPPPRNIALQVEEDGAVWPEKDDGSDESFFAFDKWRRERACEHPGCVLLHHRLGNISLIGLVRSELQREAARFSILLGKVVYNGSHAGDHLSVETIELLRVELEELASFKCGKRKSDPYIAEFRRQMNELVSAALFVRKPISF